MTSPYDHEELWIKAKLFINRAMDDEEARSFEEQALWASLSLELLAKAALARQSPLLIAEPNEDGTNLLIAAGLIEGDARFTSVRAKTLFTRCQRAFKPFNQAEATAIANARNEYLHSSGVGFAVIPPRVWWPKFWAQAVILLTALDKDVEDFVGLDRKDIVTNHLNQNAKNIEHRCETLISRAKQRLSQYRDGSLPARVAAEWKPGQDRTAGLSYHSEETCPACGAGGVLEGEDIQDTNVEWQQIDENDFERVVTHTVATEYFSCSNCQLALDGYELVEQAKLPLTFSAEGQPGDIYDESDYGND